MVYYAEANVYPGTTSDIVDRFTEFTTNELLAAGAIQAATDVQITVYATNIGGTCDSDQCMYNVEVRVVNLTEGADPIATVVNSIQYSIDSSCVKYQNGTREPTGPGCDMMQELEYTGLQITALLQDS